MFNFYLKRPQLKDFKYIYSINKKLLGDNCLPEFKARLIFEDILCDSKCFVITVHHGNRMAGYAYATEVFSLKSGHYAVIVDFATIEYYRSKGADLYLFGAMEQWATAVVCREILFTPDDEVREDLIRQLGYIKDEDSRQYRKQLYSL